MKQETRCCKVYPFLPRLQLKDVAVSLCYLPFMDKGHDVVQQQTMVAIAKKCSEIRPRSIASR